MKNMNKAVLVLGISTLAVNVASATSNNTIVGTDNTISVNSTSSMVSGFQNHIDANNAFAFGTDNTVTGENGFAGGNNATAAGRNSFAFGSHAESLVEYTIAMGNQARTSAYNTIALGNGAYANGESTVVIGRTNTVNAENATVIGSNNGTVASGHGVVVGYNNQVLDNSKEQLIFGSNSKTNSQGAIAIGTHAQSGAIDALAIGNNTLADTPNAVALGTNSTTDTAVSTDHIYINGKKFDFAGGVADSTVSVGTTNKAGMSGVMNYKRTITNVAAGRIDSTSTDAVNGSQLNAVINSLNFTTVSDGNNTTVTQSVNLDGGKEFAVHVNKDLHNINSVNFGTNVDSVHSVVNKEKAHFFNGDTNAAVTHDGLKLENTNTLDTASYTMNGMTADSNGKHVEFTTQNITTGGQQIHDLADGVADTDAVNMRQLKAQSQAGLNEINATNQRLNKLGASSAALAGLHPLDFYKDDKASYAISYGHYRNSNAVAVGAFYRPNERTMFGLGMSLGDEKQFTANVAFKLGKGSDYVAEAKDKDSRISKLETLVQQLIKEVELSKQSK